MILGNSYDIARGEWRKDANALISTQELWFAVFMTILSVFPLVSLDNHYSCYYSVLIPWFTLRQVPVEIEIVSPPFPPFFPQNRLTYVGF